MVFGGLQKNSLLDYPSKIAAVVFTIGCNFRCGFCHNPSLMNAEGCTIINEQEILSFLQSRRRVLDAVVITGGEPTLHADLLDFIRKVAEMGFLVKLDTNGTNPDVLKRCLDEHLIDYVAMDIKHRLDADWYEKTVETRLIIEHIKKSIQHILASSILHEFRTTVVDGLHTADDVRAIAESIKGAKKYALQKFIPRDSLNNETFKARVSLDDATLSALRDDCLKFVDCCEIR